MKKIPARLALIGMIILLFSCTAYAYIGGPPSPIMPYPPIDCINEVYSSEFLVFEKPCN